MGTVVWVLVITIFSGMGETTHNSTIVIDNIASAQSCEQLRQVFIRENRRLSAICAPVRKVK